MKAPFARPWSVLRGDRYMLDAYPPAADVAGDATGEAVDEGGHL